MSVRIRRAMVVPGAAVIAAAGAIVLLVVPETATSARSAPTSSPSPAKRGKDGEGATSIAASVTAPLPTSLRFARGGDDVASIPSRTTPIAVKPRAPVRAPGHEELRSALLRCGDLETRSATLDAFVNSRSAAESIPWLEKLTDRPLSGLDPADEKKFRARVIGWLGALRDPRADATLLAIVGSLEAEVADRLAAIDALGGGLGAPGCDQATPRVLQAVADNDPNPVLRRAARRVLSSRGAGFTVEPTTVRK